MKEKLIYAQLQKADQLKGLYLFTVLTKKVKMVQNKH